MVARCRLGRARFATNASKQPVVSQIVIRAKSWHTTCMASFQKVNQASADFLNGVHNCNSNTFKVYLSDSAPSATTTVYGTPADLSTGGGYTSGGAAVPGTACSQTSGTASLTGSNVVFTATTGFGPFRYAILYDATDSSKRTLGYFDYGSEVTLGASETFTVAWGSSILTLA